jgi:hypothetical protein
MHTLLIANELAFGALFYIVFCRCIRCDHTTLAAIRVAFQILGTVAAMGFVAPLMWPHLVNWLGVLLALAIVLVQTVTARYWVAGPPRQFTNSQH